MVPSNSFGSGDLRYARGSTPVSRAEPSRTYHGVRLLQVTRGPHGRMEQDEDTGMIVFFPFAKVYLSSLGSRTVDRRSCAWCASGGTFRHSNGRGEVMIRRVQKVPSSANWRCNAVLALIPESTYQKDGIRSTRRLSTFLRLRLGACAYINLGTCTAKPSPLIATSARKTATARRLTWMFRCPTVGDILCSRRRTLLITRSIGSRSRYERCVSRSVEAC